MELDYNKLIEMVEKDLSQLTRQTSLSGDDLKKMIKATCALDQLEELKMRKEERNSYGMSHTRMLPHMSYDGDITYEHGMSHRRGRSPVTGQYVSRSREYDDYGYSAHSIADRMVARLETMYDEAKSPHEKQYIDAWIDKIRHGE